jgi:Tfp pilus assembly protein PilO
MSAFTKFNFKDPLNIFMIVIVCSMLLLVTYSWFSLFEGIQAEKKALDKIVSSNTAKINKLKKLQNQEKRLDQNLKEKESRLKELKRMFPDAENVSARLRDLYSVLRKTDIDVELFKPSGKGAGPPKLKNGKIDLDNPKAYYEENYYDLTLQGGYHQFGDFFAELANFEYPTKIDAMGITVLSSMMQNVDNAMITGKEPHTISIKMKLTTFNSRKELVETKQKSKRNNKSNKKGGK